MCINLLTEPSEFPVARVAPGPKKKGTSRAAAAHQLPIARVCVLWGSPARTGPPPGCSANSTAAATAHTKTQLFASVERKVALVVLSSSHPSGCWLRLGEILFRKPHIARHVQPL